MKVSTTVTATFNCSLDRAFKTPILGDATQFLNGFLFQPAVIRFEEDETWAKGQVNGYRYPVIKGNLIPKSSRIFTDTIVERVENSYWKWEVTDFTTIFLFFAYKGVGEWTVQEVKKEQILVHYKYTYYSKNSFTHLINWLFIKIQLRGTMKKAIKGIKRQAESNEVLHYEQ